MSFTFCKSGSLIVCISIPFFLYSKKSTIEILKNIENYYRGFYSGIFGIFDGINLQSFVLIRFIENINNELFYKSGGGITSDSIVKEEYEELLNKVYLPF